MRARRPGIQMWGRCLSSRLLPFLTALSQSTTTPRFCSVPRFFAGDTIITGMPNDSYRSAFWNLSTLQDELLHSYSTRATPPPQFSDSRFPQGMSIAGPLPIWLTAICRSRTCIRISLCRSWIIVDAPRSVEVVPGQKGNAFRNLTLRRYLV